MVAARGGATDSPQRLVGSDDGRSHAEGRGNIGTWKVANGAVFVPSLSGAQLTVRTRQRLLGDEENELKSNRDHRIGKLSHRKELLLRIGCCSPAREGDWQGPEDDKPHNVGEYRRYHEMYRCSEEYILPRLYAGEQIDGEAESRIRSHELPHGRDHAEAEQHVAHN